MDAFKQFELKDSFGVEGINEDYVWYNAKILSAKMSQWDHDFNKIVNVMESRHKEHLKMIKELLDERKDLLKKIADLQATTKE
jgi:hypothetical protein